MKVVLRVRADGSVCDVLDAATSEPVAYDIVEKQDDSLPLGFVCKLFVNDGLGAREEAAVRALRDDVLAFVPLPHMAMDRQLPTGCAFAMPADAVPAIDSALPLDFFRYCTGLTAVELKTHDEETGLTMTEASFRTPEATRRFAAAADALRRRPRGAPPGVIQREAAEAFRAYTSPSFADDPLLRKWHPDPFAVWEPQLRAGDFVGVYRSNWERVNKKAKATAGHAEGEQHFYAVVGWSLPPEIVDQLAHVVKTNPRGGTWADIAARVEFQKAEELARAARERLLTAFLHVTSLAVRESCPQPVHTVSDVLRRVRVSPRALGLALPEGAPDEDRDAVVFYAGAACSLDAGPGALVMSAGDPARTIAWFHGPHATGVVGGSAWPMPAAAHALPTVGARLVPGVALLEALAAAGARPEKWGYAKLENVLLL